MSFLSNGPFSYNRFDAADRLYQSINEKKKLDPVGQEDGDIDNDGDEDSSDEYLHAKRKAIGRAMSKKKGKKEEVKEECVEENCGCGQTPCKTEEKKKKYKMKKEEITREDVFDYLIESNLVNNVVSAEVLLDHMSDAWLEEIVEDLATRTKNIIDADRAGAHGPGDHIRKLQGAAAHSMNKMNHQARYKKGKV